MPIRSTEELEHLDQFSYLRDEYGTDIKFVERVVRHAKQILDSIGISDAEISLMRDSNGEVAYGATRLPILISLPSGERYVLKQYDKSGSNQEKKVLSKLSGIFIGKILVEARTFYIEEYIDHETYISLEELAQLGNTKSACEYLGTISAALVKLNIVDTNTHIFDEVFINDVGVVRLSDVGHIEFFTVADTQEHLAQMSRYQTLVTQNPATAPLEYFKSTLIFRNDNISDRLKPEIVTEISMHLQEMSKKFGVAVFINLCRSLRTIFFALRYHYQERKIVYPWEKAAESFVDALISFKEAYIALPEEITSNFKVQPLRREDLELERGRVLLELPENDEQIQGWVKELIDREIVKISRAGTRIFVTFLLPNKAISVFFAEYSATSKIIFTRESSQQLNNMETWLSKTNVGQSDIYIEQLLQIFSEYITRYYFKK